MHPAAIRSTAGISGGGDRKRALPRENMLRRISDADLPVKLHPKYALARDLFMFSFYTRGMSFVDMIYLRKAISDGVR